MTEGAFGPEHVNAAALRGDPDSLLKWFERLIRRPPRVAGDRLRDADAADVAALALERYAARWFRVRRESRRLPP